MLIFCQIWHQISFRKELFKPEGLLSNSEYIQHGRKATRKPSTRFGNQGPRFGNHDSETRDPDRFGNQETTIRKPNWKLMVFVMVMVG